jgi:hypothetical protein
MTPQHRTQIACCTLVLTLFGSLLFSLPAHSQDGDFGIPEIDGFWGRGQCLPPNNACTVIGVDHPAVTARAKGFRAAFDQLAIPKYDCAPTPLPHLFTDPYSFQIEQLSDRVILTYEKDDIVRTIWLEGNGHPTPGVGDFFAHGYSIGRYEGNQLVVETNHFAFDPAGIDNDYILPSSTQKRVTERYSSDGERLRFEITTEDPIFLLEPVSYVLESQRVEGPLALPWACDTEAARENLPLVPSKYPEDPPVIRLR